MGNGSAPTSGPGIGFNGLVISKSDYLSGLQCPRLLWFLCRARKQLPPPDPQAQAIFEQGREVGALARQLFPGGVQIGGSLLDFEALLSQTQQALNLRRPLFEAAFRSHGGFARADILNPVGREAWDLVEVKSSTEVKEVHLNDLAFQAYIGTGAGLKIRKCWLFHINGGFVRKGKIDPRQFFQQADVTQLVSPLSRGVEPQLEKMFATLRLKKPPATPIGPHCDDPYGCPLHDLCWAFLPEDNVLTLYRGRTKGFKLLAQGTTCIRHIPPDFALTDKQAIQRQASLTGQPHVEQAALKAFLARLRYPLYFLDFETLATAIPLFDGVRPYQQVPFQFSLHLLRASDKEPEPHMFLAQGMADPRPEILSRLRNLLGESGSIVAFNAGFEQRVLAEGGQAFPEFAPWVAKLKPRFIDLLEPFRSFAYYHPQQHGSASMKAVLPALTGKGYGHMGIQNGNAASREFLRVTFGNVPEADRKQVRRQLEEYCGQDTLGMIWIMRELQRLI